MDSHVSRQAGSHEGRQTWAAGVGQGQASLIHLHLNLLSGSDRHLFTSLAFTFTDLSGCTADIRQEKELFGNDAPTHMKEQERAVTELKHVMRRSEETITAAMDKNLEFYEK